MSRRVGQLLVALAALVGVTVLVGLGLEAALLVSVGDRVHHVDTVPARPVGIVFGAGLGSSLLRDRVEAGAALVRAGKVRRLILSGDNRVRAHDEPRAMRRLALAAGVPDGALVLDYAGRHTFDTCARAREIFGVDGAILVTQRFHLPRALYLCGRLGLDVVGVPAGDSGREVGLRLYARELLAVAKAWFDVNVHRPPVVGGPAIPLVEPEPEPDAPVVPAALVTPVVDRERPATTAE